MRCFKLIILSLATLFLIGFPSITWAQLVAHWNFDEAAGTTAADISGSANVHSATLNGGSVFNPTGGVLGGSVSLNGIDGFVSAADQADLDFAAGQSWGISTWFNSTTSQGSNNGLWTKGYADSSRSDDGYHLLQLHDSDGDIQFDSRRDSGNTPRFRPSAVGPDLVDGAWHNLVVTRDMSTLTDGELRIYIDGGLVQTTAISSNDGDWAMGDNTDQFVIGNHSNRFTEGEFDETAIWVSELTDGEAIALYNLALDADLEYDASTANLLFEAFADSQSVVIGDLQWTPTDGLGIGNGQVNEVDGVFSLQLDAAGNGLIGSASVPEPTSLLLWSLLGCGIFGWVLRRRRA